MTDIEPGTLLSDPARAGTCFVDAEGRDALASVAASLGFLVAGADLADARDKTTLIDALAAALKSPDTFGHNWDALADSLGDLGWLPAPGYMLLLDNIAGLREAAPRDYHTLLDILDEATRSHAGAGVPFWTAISAPPPA